MDDNKFADGLIKDAPSGVRVGYVGEQHGTRVIRWWVGARFGISLRVESGCDWADGIEIMADPGSRGGFRTFGNPEYLEGRSQVIDFLRRVISEYHTTVQF